MSTDPHIEQLLAGYPEQLSLAELDELRAAAELDPDLDAMIGALHDVEELLRDGDPIVEPAPLSAAGQQRLDQLVEEAKAWTQGGATPANRVGGGEVVSLAEARARRRPPTAVLLALAAGLLLALALFAQHRPATDSGFGGGEDFRAKGADDVESGLTGSLFVMGEARVSSGDQRPVDRSVAFRAQLAGDMALALIESQGGESFVLHPSPGGQWLGVAGSNLLQAGGGAYRPAAAGEATYTLVGAPRGLRIPTDRSVASVDAFLAASEGAVVLDSLSIRWTEAP